MRRDIGEVRRQARRGDDEGGSARREGDQGLGSERQGRGRRVVARRGVAGGDFGR